MEQFATFSLLACGSTEQPIRSGRALHDAGLRSEPRCSQQDWFSPCSDRGTRPKNCAKFFTESGMVSCYHHK